MQSSSPDVRGRFERWFETEVVDPMADFRNPRQEWRRLVSEFAGTFFLVLVAAGGGMMSQAFPDTISRTAAVVAPVVPLATLVDRVARRAAPSRGELSNASP